jgi:hypothetical protein
MRDGVSSLCKSVTRCANETCHRSLVLKRLELDEVGRMMAKESCHVFSV